MRQGYSDILYDGSDFVKSSSRGVKETSSVINMVILGIFGGNVESVWWGASHGYSEISETEKLLRSIVLSSSTPSIVEKSVLQDLSYLGENFEIKCECEVPFRDRLNIKIYISPKGTDKTDLISIDWALTPDDSGGYMLGFDYSLNFEMN